MWELFQKAKTFRSRPSELLGVSDAFVAYCLDSAVYTFGRSLESELESIEGKSKQEIKRKQERVMNKWLDMPMRFRNPGVVGPGAKSGVEQEFTVKGDGS